MRISPPARKATLRQRIFAYMNANRSTFELTEAQHKRSLFGGLHGNVLELGPGSGVNLAYYPADVQWIGVEPNPAMLPYLQRAIAQTGRSPEHFRIDSGDPNGIKLPAGDASMDAVVGTLVLCSVPDPSATLREILRILKPGGQYVFLEHVAAPRGTRMRKMQNFIQPVWSFLAEGCHPNRETWETISQAGFAKVNLEHYQHTGGGPASPFIAGSVIKGI